MDIKKFTEANRDAWNEVIPIHQKTREINLKERFKEKGFSCLDELEISKLQQLSLKGKKVAQLCCNNGREVLSIINMGAESAVGFDISDEAIKEARELAEISKLKCSFIRTDVYDIGEEYYDIFDLVYISIGVLNWLPDISKFFNIASKLLKKDGMLFIYEMHPVAFMFASEGEEGFDSENPLKLCYSYFKKEPLVLNKGIDYVGKTTYQSKTNYEFSHSLSDIFNSILQNGISIKEFSEYEHDISWVFEHLEKEKMLPLCYILIGKKEQFI